MRDQQKRERPFPLSETAIAKCARTGSAQLSLNLIPRPGKRHESYWDNGSRPRLTRRDLFDDGELLPRRCRPQWHDQAATHLELLYQRRRDMAKGRSAGSGPFRDPIGPTAPGSNGTVARDGSRGIVTAEASR